MGSIIYSAVQSKHVRLSLELWNTKKIGFDTRKWDSDQRVASISTKPSDAASTATQSTCLGVMAMARS